MFEIGFGEGIFGIVALAILIGLLSGWRPWRRRGERFGDVFEDDWPKQKTIDERFRSIDGQ